MKRIIAIGILTALFTIMMSAGVSAGNIVGNAAEQDISNGIIGNESVTDGTNGISMNSGSALSIPQELETIPEGYYSPGAQQGTLVELYYDTYESKTYGQKRSSFKSGPLSISHMATAKIRNTMCFTSCMAEGAMKQEHLEHRIVRRL